MEIYIASDHAGFAYKTLLCGYLEEKNYNIIDCGTDSEERVDYPDYAYKVCYALQKNEGAFGILLCGSGIGMSIYANRYKGIRAGLCTTEYQSKVTREHNNANILCTGTRVVGIDILYSMVDIFLTTKFQGGRHSARVAKLDMIKKL